MAGLSTTMSWIFQVVDRGASARVAGFSNQLSVAERRTTQYRSALARTRSTTRGFALQTASAGVLAFGLGMAVRSAVTAFAEFEEKLTSTRLTLRANHQEMEILRRQAMSLPGMIEFGPSKIAQVQKELGQAGFSMQELMKSTPLVADLATAGMIKLADATKLNVNVLRGFRIPVSQGRKSMDQMLRATQLTPIAMDEMSKALGFATGRAASFNQTLATTVITLGALKPVTRTASKAGTSLGATLTAVLSARGSKILDSLGVGVTDAEGNVRQLPDILYDVQDALQSVAASERQALLSRLLGIRGMQTYTAVTAMTAQGVGKMAGVTLRGREAWEQLQKSVDSADGTMSKFSRGLRDTYAGTTGRLSASWESATIAIGDGFTPAIIDLSKEMIPIVTYFTTFLQLADGMPAKFMAGALALNMFTRAGQAAAFATQAWMASRVGMGGTQMSMLGPPLISGIGGEVTVGGGRMARMRNAYRANLQGVRDRAMDKTVQSQMRQSAAGTVFSPGNQASMRNQAYVNMQTRLASSRLARASQSASAGFRTVASSIPSAVGMFTAVATVGMSVVAMMEAYKTTLNQLHDVEEQRAKRTRGRLAVMTDARDFFKMVVEANGAPLERSDRLAEVLSNLQDANFASDLGPTLAAYKAGTVTTLDGMLTHLQKTAFPESALPNMTGTDADSHRSAIRSLTRMALQAKLAAPTAATGNIIDVITFADQTGTGQLKQMSSLAHQRASGVLAGAEGKSQLFQEEVAEAFWMEGLFSGFRASTAANQAGKAAALDADLSAHGNLRISVDLDGKPLIDDVSLAALENQIKLERGDRSATVEWRPGFAGKF